MTQQLAKRYTFHYTGIQLFYFTGFAAIFTYAAVFLRDRGFSSQEIGLTLALANLTTLIMQPMIAHWVDRSQTLKIHHISSLLAGLLFIAEIALVFIPPIFLLVVIFYVLTMMLFLVLQTLLISLSFKMTNRGVTVNFGLARGLGSGAFALVSFGAGYAIDRFDATAAPLIAAISTIFTAILVFTFRLKIQTGDDKEIANSTSSASSQSQKETVPAQSLGQFFHHYPQLPLIMFGLVFVFLNLSIFVSYQINIVEAIGGSSQTLGLATAISAVQEIPVMMFFYLLVRRFKSGSLLITSTVFFAVKTFATWLAPSVNFYLATQLLQFGAFALYLPASVYFLNTLLEDRDLVKGQAYVAMATTIGSISGNLLGGIILDLSTVSTALLVATGSGVIGTILVIIGVGVRHEPDTKMS